MGDEQSPHFFDRGKGKIMDVPKHVAVIMDGNGRWAQRRGMERFKGHIEGMKRIGEIVNAASDLGISFLTLYTFSKQNWQRPQSEVAMLMKLICLGLEQKVDDLIRKNVRFNFIGQQEGVPNDVLTRLEKTREATSRSTGLQVNLAFNYDGRTEILDGVKAAVRAVQDHQIRIDEIDEKFFSTVLYTQGLPDPDLVIRTSGEQRISNFLLWQISYSELYFTDVFWPDFTKEEFSKAINDYQHRERRFGDVAPPSRSL